VLLVTDTVKNNDRKASFCRLINETGKEDIVSHHKDCGFWPSAMKEILSQSIRIPYAIAPDTPNLNFSK